MPRLRMEDCFLSSESPNFGFLFLGGMGLHSFLHAETGGVLDNVSALNLAQLHFVERKRGCGANPHSDVKTSCLINFLEILSPDRHSLQTESNEH